MRGKLIASENGDIELELFDVNGQSLGTFKIDKNVSQNVHYMQILIHNNQAELMLDASELSKTAAREIIDFIPKRHDIACLQLALKAVIDDDFKYKCKLDKHVR